MKSTNLYLYFLVFSFLSCSCAARPQVLDGQIIDLSYAFDEETIYWPTEKGFSLERKNEGFTDKGYYYAANRFEAAEHGGTHVDAPRHFSQKGHTVDQIPLKQLIGPAILVDVSDKCNNDPDYQIEVEDFLAWERKNGPIPKDVMVLIKTGFGKYWPNRVQYMGTDERGVESVKKLHFPGLHPKAVDWLTQRRFIKAVGIDTPSIDHGQSTHFGSHVALSQKNIPVFENLAHLDRLPSKNFVIIALPMKIKDGSGGPTRIVAVE